MTSATTLKLGLALLAGAGFSALPAHAGGNLVQDGGFELASPGATNNDTTDYKAVSSFDGGLWTVTQGITGIDTTNEYVYAGNRSLYLSDGPGLDAVSQTLNTVAGQKYTISFYANADGNNAFSLLFGGTPVANAPTTIDQGGFANSGANANAGSFTFYTATATANSNSTVLTLEGIGGFPGGGGSTVEIDNVSVSAAPVPEASSAISLGLLLMLGLGGVAVARRKKAASAV